MTIVQCALLFIQKLAIESIDVGNLSALVVSAKKCDLVRPSIT